MPEKINQLYLPRRHAADAAKYKGNPDAVEVRKIQSSL